MQQIFEPDTPEHLGANAIGDAVDDLCSILGRVDMDAKGPFAERCTSSISSEQLIR